MSPNGDLPDAVEQEKRLLGSPISWEDDESYRTVEVPSERLHDLIEGTYLGQSYLKSVGYTYEDAYGLLSDFNVKTKVQLVKDEGILLDANIHIPAKGPSELYKRWLVEFIADADDTGDYIRFHHD